MVLTETTHGEPVAQGAGDVAQVHGDGAVAVLLDRALDGGEVAVGELLEGSRCGRAGRGGLVAAEGDLGLQVVDDVDAVGLEGRVEVQPPERGLDLAHQGHGPAVVTGAGVNVVLALSEPENDAVRAAVAALLDGCHGSLWFVEESPWR